MNRQTETLSSTLVNILTYICCTIINVATFKYTSQLVVTWNTASNDPITNLFNNVHMLIDAFFMLLILAFPFIAILSKSLDGFTYFKKILYLLAPAIASVLYTVIYIGMK